MQRVSRFIAIIALLAAVGIASAANKTWTGSVSTDWFVPGNWNPAGVPTNSDSVIISAGSPVANTNVVVASLSLSGGSCTFNGPAELGSLTLSGNGTLGGTNVVEVTNLVWTAGSMVGVGGVTRVVEGGTLLVNVPPGYTVNLAQRMLHNAGSAVWTNVGTIFGYYGAVITNSGTWEVQSDATMDLYGSYLPRPTFLNGGLFVKSGGGGTTTFRDTAFCNSGIVQLLKGRLELQYGGSQSGSIEVATNTTLVFSTAAPVWQPGATISGDGRIVFSVATTFSGTDLSIRTLDVSSTATFNSPVTSDSLTLSGSVTMNGPLRTRTLNLTGSGTFNGALDVITLALTGTGTFNSPARVGSLTLSGNGTLGGTNVVEVTNLVWTGGTMAGAGGVTRVVEGGTLLLNVPPGYTVSLAQRMLHNAGSAVWTNMGTIFGYYGAVITNSGTWEVQSDALMDLYGSYLPRPTFLNGGLFVKSGGGGTTTFRDTLFCNSGTVRVDRGTLRLEYGGASSGSYQTASNAVLTFYAGTHVVGAGGEIGGSGRVQMGGVFTFQGSRVEAGFLDVLSGANATVSGPVSVSGAVTVSGTGVFQGEVHGGSLSVGGTGTFQGAVQALGSGSISGTATFNGAVDVTTLALTGSGSFNSPARVGSLTLSGNGTLGGTNVVEVTNLVWTAGSMVGVGGVTRVVEGGTLLLNVLPGYTVNLAQRLLHNAGSAVWTNVGTIQGYYGAVITNSGTWEVQSDATMDLYASYTPRPTFLNGGLFVKSGGGGTTTFRDTVFNNSAIVRLDRGTLSFSGDRYTQAEGSTDLNGGGLASNPYPIQILGGELSGVGTISASVVNRGELNPGASPGLLTITGAFTNVGVVNIEIGGLTAGTEFDQVRVSGMASLGGVMNVTSVDGFQPNLGESFRVLTHGSRIGTFFGISGLNLDGGTALQAIYSTTNLTLVATNGPTNLLHLTITSPTNNNQFLEESPVSLQVQSSGGEPPIIYTWQSDRDGTLGTNASLLVSNLTAGIHRLSVRGQDSAGASDVASMQITILPAPTTVTVDLQTASDTGASSTDNLTRNTTPDFDVTVSKRGRIEFDHTGDGVADEIRTNSVAGTFTFRAGPWTNGPHTVTAKFIPNQGNTVQASLIVTIDTLGARILALTPTGNVSNRVDSVLVTFNTATDNSSFGTNDVVITGTSVPPIASVQHPASNTWRFNFASPPLSGSYTFDMGPGVLDLAGNAMDQDGDGTNGEPEEDVFHTTMTVFLPDLLAAVHSTPTNAQMGQPVSLVFGMTNAGAATAQLPWRYAILLATNSAGAGAQTLATIPSPLAFAPGQGLVLTQSVILPAGQFGQRYLGIRVDSSGEVFEDIETNNVAFAVLPTEIQAPDLVVADLVAPGAAHFGETLSIRWLVVNDGTGPALSPWNDRLYLSRSSNSVAGATLLASMSAADVVPLVAGSNYVRAQSITLPLDASVQPGNYFFIALADHANTQAESSETNNLRATPVLLTLPPLPDLAIVDWAAPATLRLGLPHELTWVVTNRGDATAAAPWRELLMISNAVSGLRALAELRGTNSIEPGGFLVRTQAVSFPIETPAGPLQFIAQVDSQADVTESDESNNTLAATNLTIVPAQITLLLPASQLAEGASLNAAVRRNGDTGGALTVALASSDDGEASVTNEVTIPVGQATASVAIRALTDGVVDGSQTVFLTAAAPGYESGTNQLTVLDVDVPRLGLELSGAFLSEGATLTATVSRDFGTNESLTVSIRCADTVRLGMPAALVIPEGQWSQTFPILAIDDSLVQGSSTNAISVSASGFVGATAAVTVLDDEATSVALTVSSGSVSEGGGPQAAMGTVTREAATSRALVVDLESSDPASLLVPAHVVIPANERSASFFLAAVDNPIVDGPRSVVLTPFVTASGTGARLFTGLPAVVEVTDDDGPTLRLLLARKLVAEGLAPATVASVSRNTPTTEALTVNLASSDPTEATVPTSVTIPAGVSAVTVDVASVADGVGDGNQRVILTASAPDFTGGSDTLVVSDVDWPDLVVASLTAPETVETEASYSVTYRVVNQGLGATSTNWLTRVYFSADPLVGGDSLVGEYAFSSSLAPGQFFEQTLSVRAPVNTGPGWLIVVTDVGNRISEVLEDNNTRVSTAPVQVQAAYRATVETEVTTALNGTPVPLRGRAYRPGSGLAVPNALVNIHLTTRGTRRILSALTDAAGHYAITFTPLSSEAGHYTVGADHPGVTETAVQDEFSLLGMEANPRYLLLPATGQSSVTGTVALVNLGDLPLSGLSATVVSNPANLLIQFAVDGGGALPGSGRIPLQCEVAVGDTPPPGAVALVRVSSAEGPVVDFPLYVSVQPLRAQLAAVPETLAAGVVRGRQTTLEFAVVNTGGATSGPVTLSLPSISWMHVASTNPLPSLPPGETNRVTLLLTPAADTPFGVQGGTLVLSAGGSHLAVPFELRVLSEARGDLKLTVVDEYTYYAQGSPKVTNAAVTLFDSLTREVRATGTTGSQGELLLTNLVESYCDLEIKAEAHGSFRSTIFLAAGKTNELTAFLPRQTVRYSWSVVPTEIEDRTRIVLETTFESYVPIPVITVEPASFDLAQITQDVAQVSFTIANHGLIAAESGRLVFGKHPLWEVTPLTEDVGTVPAMGSITIPVTFRKLSLMSPAARTSASPKAGQPGASVDPCNLPASFAYQLICGIHYNTYQSPIALYNAAKCGLPLPTLPQYPLPEGRDIVIPPAPAELRRIYELLTTPSGAVTELPEAPFDPFGWAGSSAPITPEVHEWAHVTAPNLVSNLCDPCNFMRLWTLAGCVYDFFLPDPTDLEGCIENVKECVFSLDPTQCIDAGLSCVIAGAEEIPGIAQAAALAQCANNLLSACDKVPGGTSETPKSRADNASGATLPSAYARPRSKLAGSQPGSLALVEQRVQRLGARLDVFLALFGDESWFNVGFGTNGTQWLAAFETRRRADTADGARISPAERTELLALPLPEGLAASSVEKFIDRWNRTLEYQSAGIFDLSQVPAGQSTDFIPRDLFTNTVSLAHEAVLADRAEGITNPTEALRAAVQLARDELNQGGGGGVCGRVTLQLDQQAVVSRDAFSATLEVANESIHDLGNVSAQISVLDANGQEAAARFGLQPPTLENVTAVDGTGTLPAGATARIGWTIIPTVEAAPERPLVYYVSGILSYMQDGLAVAMPLTGVPITVHPTPRLSVKYFHERDVLSDDPFTDVVEPAVPFNLAVMVENRGQGVAKNLRITSGQPRIVENEKGLLVDFKILASEVEGRNLSPSLTVNFGDLTNGQRALGRWLLTASLQGLFTDYQASFEHRDGLGNNQLSLFEDITIHELIRLVEAGGAFADGRPDFLVNEVPDPGDLPDTLYLSDGTTNSVTAVEEASIDQAPAPGDLVVQLTAPLPSGWGYLRVPDPGTNQFRLTRVVRSDGREIAVGTNVWTTDRTFVGLGKRPIYENRLHLLDHDSPGVYTLYYAVPPAPDTNAPSSSVAALPADSPPAFPVSWSGQDDGGAVDAFDIWVSVNASPFVPWLQRTRLTGATYLGTYGAQYAFYSIATDAGGNRESPPEMPDAVTTVTISNHPPVFAPLGEQSIDEGSPLDLTVAATDADGAGDVLTYSLAAGAPPGALFNSASGRITWATGEGTGPSTNQFLVVARDSGLPSLTATTLVTVIVREVNTPPALAAIPGRIINEGAWLVFTNRATDRDWPANTLHFALRADAPAGAAVDAASGLFRWRPTELQGPSTNLIAVVVSDDGSPSLSATQAFTVVVRDYLSDFGISLGSTNLFTGESNSVPVMLTSAIDLTNIVLLLESRAERLTNFALQANATEVLASVLQPAGSNRYELGFTLDAARLQPGTRPLGQLSFAAVAGQSSAIVPLNVVQVRGTRLSGMAVDNAAGGSGHVIVVGREPVLWLERGTPPVLTLFGRPDTVYTVECHSNLLAGATWTEFRSFPLTNRFERLPVSHWPSSPMFYRAYEVGDAGPRLSVEKAGGQMLWLQVHARPGAAILLQTTTNLGDPAAWRSILDLTLTNGVQLLDWTNAAEPARFFRALPR